MPEERNNVVDTPEEEGVSFFEIPVIKLLLSKIKIIILFAIIGVFLSFGLASVACKPYYEASCTVIFKVNESDDTSNTDKISLAKKLIPSVVYVLKTSIVDIANKGIKDGNYLSRNSISSSYNEDSLLFTLSYTDVSRENAINKLNLLFETAEKDNTLLNYIQASEFKLLKTQHTPSVSSGTRKLLFTVIGTVLFCILVCGVIILINVLDHTVRDRDELEKLSESNVIAYIDDFAKSKSSATSVKQKPAVASPDKN